MNTSLKITQNYQGLIDKLIAMNKMLQEKSYQPYMRYFYKNNDKITASDGKQLARLDHDILNDLENGFYSFIKKSTKEYFLVKEDLDCNYPDIQSFIDMSYEYQKTKITIDSKDSTTFAYQICNLILETNCVFNFELVKNIQDLSSEWSVYYKDNRQHLMFETPDRLFQYMIMPIRTQD
jgi:hypothetical protein